VLGTLRLAQLAGEPGKGLDQDIGEPLTYLRRELELSIHGVVHGSGHNEALGDALSRRRLSTADAGGHECRKVDIIPINSRPDRASAAPNGSCDSQGEILNPRAADLRPQPTRG